jgi:hypothetical protein
MFGDIQKRHVCPHFSIKRTLQPDEPIFLSKGWKSALSSGKAKAFSNG